MQSFTPLLSNKRSSGPVQYRTGNPRGGFPRVWGLPDYVSSSQPVRSHWTLPECRYRPNWLPPTPPEPPDDRRPPPTSYSRTGLSAHSLTLGKHKYVWAFTVPLLYYPGFHRTAVLHVCLSEPHTTRDPHGSPYFSTEHNPPNTCISINTTRCTFYLQHPCVSLKTAATTELPEEAPCHSTHTPTDIAQATHANVII